MTHSYSPLPMDDFIENGPPSQRNTDAARPSLYRRDSLNNDDDDGDVSPLWSSDTSISEEDVTVGEITATDRLNCLSRHGANTQPKWCSTAASWASAFTSPCAIKGRNLAAGLFAFGAVTLIASLCIAFSQGVDWFVIDKSVDSFRVPDHVAVTRVHMLEEAVKEMLWNTKHDHSKTSYSASNSVRGQSPSAAPNSHSVPTSKLKPVWSHMAPNGSTSRWRRDESRSREQSLSRISGATRNRREAADKFRVESFSRSKRAVSASPSDHQCFRHDIVYVFLLASVDGTLVSGSDMFRLDRLKIAVDIETRLKESTGVVWNTVSLLNLLRSGPERSLPTDQVGVKQLLTAGKKIFVSASSYLDATSFAVNMTSRFLRIKLRLSCGEHVDMLHKFINLVEGMSTQEVTVIYGSDSLFSLQLDDTIWSDLRLAATSLGLIAALMLAFTSASFWLTICGLVCIGASLLLALVIYFWLTPFDSLGILNVAGVFLILGVGVDDVFVFINVYQQAHPMLTINQKVLHTIKTAGAATFLTSFTTAAAFTGNIVSPIHALSQFGVFMTSVVLCCWFFIILFMPAALVVWDMFWSTIGKECPVTASSVKWCFPASSSCAVGRVPDDIAMAAQTLKYEANSGAQGADSDVPMLQLVFPDTDNGGGSANVEAGSDVGMLLSSDSSAASQLENVSSAARVSLGCAGTIQWLLYSAMKTLLKGKWIVFVLFFAVLGASAGVDSLLKTSSDTLQLFEDGSNLQLWYNFRESLTRQDIECDSCSSDFLNGGGNIPPVIPGLLSTTTVMSPTKYTDPPTTATTASPEVSPITAQSTEQTKPAPASTITPVMHPTVDSKTAPTSSTPPVHGITTAGPHVVQPTPTRLPMTSPQTTTSSTPIPSTLAPTSSTSQPTRSTTTTEVPTTTASALAKDVVQGKAVVYVVFGLKGLLKKKRPGHVIQQKGDEEVIYDEEFSKVFNFTALASSHSSPLSLLSLFQGSAPSKDTPTLPPAMEQLRIALRDMCTLCKSLAADRSLVQPDGADCITVPTGGSGRVAQAASSISFILTAIPECRNLPRNGLSSAKAESAKGKLRTFTALAGTSPDEDAVLWMSSAFKSTTGTEGHYYEAYRDYQAWEDAIEKHRFNLSIPLQSVFQTSSFWEKVIREVASVNSAVYSVGFSLLVSAWSVATFMAHPGILLIVMTTIIAEVSLVVAIFWLMGWSVGPVEAICLSILVGTAVDYCLHVAEAYLIVGKNLPSNYKKPGTASAARSWRSLAAVSHIGAPVLASALTTALAALPLTKAAITPFSRFGVIMLVNTCVSAVYSLGVVPHLLAAVGPARWKPRAIWHIVSCVVASVLVAGVLLALYLLSASKMIALPLGSISA